MYPLSFLRLSLAFGYKQETRDLVHLGVVWEQIFPPEIPHTYPEHQVRHDVSRRHNRSRQLFPWFRPQIGWWGEFKEFIFACSFDARSIVSVYARLRLREKICRYIWQALNGMNHFLTPMNSTAWFPRCNILLPHNIFGFRLHFLRPYLGALAQLGTDWHLFYRSYGFFCVMRCKVSGYWNGRENSNSLH